MPTPAKGRYHHGDLRAALVDVAVELIAEGGVRGFSMAEASRRLGVAASAPYAHYADRDALLAGVAVHAYDVFNGELARDVDPSLGAAERLAGIARCYVRFAGLHRPLFEVLFLAGIDKRRHPEVKAAEKPLADAVLASVETLSDGVPSLSDDLATAVEAAAHGHAMLLLDGCFGEGDAAAEEAAGRAAAATLALVEGRERLRGRGGAPTR
jgi:AcrR family transcriptional regulator